jgi:hypothetical protein
MRRNLQVEFENVKVFSLWKMLIGDWFLYRFVGLLSCGKCGEIELMNVKKII